MEICNNLIYGAKAYSAEWIEIFHLMSSVATQELITLFDQADDLLNRCLDNLMKIFVNSVPNFYHGYLKARVIGDY